MDQKQPRKGIYLLPNLLTTAGLFAGFYAVVAAMKGMFDVAGIAVFIAMIADGMDGRVARITNSVSEFGAQYDSLSDLVAFGVAPSLVAYQWALGSLGKKGWLVAFWFTVSTALRLARFNTHGDVLDKRYFIGLPCPSAAGVIAGMMWAASEYGIHGHDFPYVVAVVTSLTALLMVSNIPYYSFKEIDFRGKVPFMAVLVIIFVFMCVSIDPPVILFGVFSIYAASGPVMWLLNKRQHKDA